MFGGNSLSHGGEGRMVTGGRDTKGGSDEWNGSGD